MVRVRQRLRARRFNHLEPHPRYDRPDRCLIVTGIPRSGTSLLAALISESPNAYCVNEVFYAVDGLPLNLWRTRHCLVERRPVPNKYSKGGQLTTNTVRDSALVEFRRVPGRFDEEAVVASNVNVPYLDRIDRILEYGFPVVAVVRDPLYTIASWNSVPARSNPEFRVTDHDRHPRWSHLSFPDDDRIIRQAIIWRDLAQRIAKLRRAGAVSVVSYKRLVAGGTMLGSSLPGWSIDAPQRADMDVEIRYRDVPLDRIREAIARSDLREIYGQLIDLEGGM